MLKVNLLFTLVFSFHFIAGQDKSDESITIIKSLRKASNECILKRDADCLSESYLKDFVLIRGNGTHVTGKDTVMAIWKEMFKENPEVSFVRSPTEVSINDQNVMAWETGTWTGTNTYSKGGNYSAMWRNTDGVWKLQAELFVALK
jgi:ketosteroid isomerase-like protein